METIVLLSLIFTFLIIFTSFILFQMQLKRNKTKSELEHAKNAFSALWEVEKVTLNTLDFEEVVDRVANTILSQLGYLKLGYQIVVLALKEDGFLRRISISKTEGAKKFLDKSPTPFREILIPMSSTNNLCVRAVLENKVFVTHKVADLLSPALDKEFVEDLQREIGIKASMVYPISSKGKILGVLIFSMTKTENDVTEYERAIIDSFIGAVGIAVENSSLFGQLQRTSGELRIANEKLKELDKLKDEFVSVASHELRTPMTAIKSYLWMALNKKKNDLSPDLARYLNRSYISVERLISMVNDMLNISRIEGGRVALKLSEVDIVELAHEAIEELAPKASEKGLELVVEDRQIPKVLCDKDKIHEVYLNLAGNSLKFTPAGGRITISFEQKSPYIYITVADTGRGIAKEDVSKLFTKFGRLENSYVAVAESGGTGLGLYITKSLVELHKGTVDVTSEGLGHGCQFTFSLPIAYTPVADQLQREAPRESGQTKDLEKTTITL